MPENIPESPRKDQARALPPGPIRSLVFRLLPALRSREGSRQRNVCPRNRLIEPATESHRLLLRRPLESRKPQAKEKRTERSTSCGASRGDDASASRGSRSRSRPGSGSGQRRRRWIEQQSRGPQLVEGYFLSWLFRVSVVRTVSGSYVFFLAEAWPITSLVELHRPNAARSEQKDRTANSP